VGFGDRRIEGEEQGKAVVNKLKDATEKQVVPRETCLPEGPQGATPCLPVVVQPHRREPHMYKGQTVFLQLTDHLPHRTYRRLVKCYNANHRVRSFTYWEQFQVAMDFAQLTYRESPRASARPTTWGDDSSLP
jgi:hypothetical protein